MPFNKPSLSGDVTENLACDAKVDAWMNYVLALSLSIGTVGCHPRGTTSKTESRHPRFAMAKHKSFAHPLSRSNASPVVFDCLRKGCDGYNQTDVTGDTPKTLYVSCSTCNKIHVVLATDIHDQVKRVTAFLQGKVPRLEFAPKTSEFDKMRQIFGFVCTEFEYANDPRGDSWKMPMETWNDGFGDCEDTSLLLVAMLRAEGINARMAIGREARIGNHAFVVVKIDDVEYVLESTHDQEALPIPLEGSGYEIEVLFDDQDVRVEEEGKLVVLPR